MLARRGKTHRAKWTSGLRLCVNHPGVGDVQGAEHALGFLQGFLVFEVRLGVGDDACAYAVGEGGAVEGMSEGVGRGVGWVVGVVGIGPGTARLAGRVWGLLVARLEHCVFGRFHAYQARQDSICALIASMKRVVEN